MTAAENKALVLEALELINNRELDAVFDHVAEDYRYHGPGGQELRGRAEIRDLWLGFFEAFPDLKATADDIFAEGDRVALRWTIEGTHEGDFLGIPPTGKRFVIPIVEIFLIEGGKLTEAWDHFDRMHLLEQIGALPEPAAV